MGTSGVGKTTGTLYFILRCLDLPHGGVIVWTLSTLRERYRIWSIADGSLALAYASLLDTPNAFNLDLQDRNNVHFYDLYVWWLR